eukprot:5999687-Pleurochrysis_carterae.AAC.1
MHFNSYRIQYVINKLHGSGDCTVICNRPGQPSWQSSSTVHHHHANGCSGRGQHHNPPRAG